MLSVSFEVLRDAADPKRSELWFNNSWIWHDDNAPLHWARIMLDFLIKQQINIIRLPPNSTGLASCDFSSSENSNSPPKNSNCTVRGKRFESLEMKENETKELKIIPFHRPTKSVWMTVGWSVDKCVLIRMVAVLK